MKNLFILCVFAALILSGCGGPSQSSLKVAATSVPHAELLEFIKPELEAQNIHLEIIVMDDYNTPNRALADGEVKANFFQHLPFLEAQIADFGYELEPLVAIHLEPISIYSKKIPSLKNLKDGSKIALPSDPSNQARALVLLEQSGLISLKQKGTKTSVVDIASNPHNLTFIELDSPLLSRALDDVDAAAISTNFALLAGLSPKNDALATENKKSDFANIIVIRKGEKSEPDLLTLKAALTTEKVRRHIEEKYLGGIIPAF
jgi:D-methionine transport system substrate-binding protein